ncbi:hypothetical protein KR093_009660 [Drosophila rubida]|uniref:Uncharacterized protein n=1 Tax=Drosophila rubida TaxID=30044 RepID=A0AAD4JS65_9MUSC|nr:hypothetical protein KR093_009660 [Drosophila rubida]
MSRWLAFSLALALVCSTCNAGLRDWLDRADAIALAFEDFSLFPSRMIFSILGTRKTPPPPMKRITAEVSDNSDIITVIRSPADDPEATQRTNRGGALSSIQDRISNRIDKVQEQIGDGVSAVANKVSERLGGVGGGLINGLGGVTSRLAGGLFRGGRDAPAVGRISNIGLFGNDQSADDSYRVEPKVRFAADDILIHSGKPLGDDFSLDQNSQGNDSVPKRNSRNDGNIGKQKKESENVGGNIVSGVTEQVSGIGNQFLNMFG